MAGVLPPPLAAFDVKRGVGESVDSICVAVAVLVSSIEVDEATVGPLEGSGVGVSELPTTAFPDSGVVVSCVSEGVSDGSEVGAIATDVTVGAGKTLVVDELNKEVRLKRTANITAAATVPTKVNHVEGEEEKIQLRPLLFDTVVASGTGGFCVGVRRWAI